MSVWYDHGILWIPLYKKKKYILRRKWGSRIHGRTTKGCLIKIKGERWGGYWVFRHRWSSSCLHFWTEMYDRCVIGYHLFYSKINGRTSCVRNMGIERLHCIVVITNSCHVLFYSVKFPWLFVTVNLCDH